MPLRRSTRGNNAPCPPIPASEAPPAPVAVPKTKSKKGKVSALRGTAKEDSTPPVALAAAEAPHSPIEVTQQTSAKHQRPTSTTTPVKATKKQRTIQNTSNPRDPLPERSARVINPGLVDASRPKRTPAQVAKAKQELQAMRKAAEELKARERELLAVMELEEEEQQANEDLYAIDHISDLRIATDTGLCEDGEDELMKLLVDVNHQTFEDDDEPSGEYKKVQRLAKPKDGGGSKAPSSKGSRKLGKGETRAAVDAVKERIRAGKGSTSAIDRLAFPSGLYPNWKERTTVVPHLPQSTPSNGPQIEPDAFLLGGLKDDDIEAKYPTRNFITSSRNVHQNNLVSIGECDTVPVGVVTRVPARNVTKTAAATKTKPRSTKTETFESALTMTTASAIRQPTPSITIETANQSIYTASSQAVVSHSLSRKGAESVTNIHPAIRTTWLTRFLPAIYHGFFASDAPFTNFTKSAELVTFLQRIVDQLHPELDYAVTIDNPIVSTAYARVNEKRSLFSKTAFRLVQDFLQQPRFLSSDSSALEYCRWALSATGPALWKVPVPAGEEGEPDGLFESFFIEETFAHVIKTVKTSPINFGFPRGALALSAAAVERAFTVFLSDDSKMPEFSLENAGNMVSDYLVNIEKFSPRRREYFAGLVDLTLKPKTEAAQPDLQSLGRKRHILYTGSPVKAMD